jgi:hypothetical protein
MRGRRLTFRGSYLAALALAAGVTVSPPSELAAQRRTTGGLVLGLNSSQVVEEEASSNRRTSWVGGVYVDLPLAGVFSFRPELLLTNKGGKGGNGVLDFEVRLAYLQLPLLLNVDLTSSGPIHPHFFAGPTFSLRVGCDIATDLIGGGGDVTIGCGDAEGGDPIKKTEMSGVIGGGVKFDTWGVGVRYDHGLSKINDFEDGPDINAKLRTITFYGTLLTVGRREP